MTSSWSWKAGLAGIAMIGATTCATAQHDHSAAGEKASPGDPGRQQTVQQGDMHSRMMQAKQKMMMEGKMKEGKTTDQPVMSGQEAFAAIQEIVRILEADPATDWSKVNISALREHLIDMDEVTMHAAAAERAFDNGIEITVTGEGRTLQAIKRMVPAHVHELAHLGWNAAAEDLPNGVRLVVTSDDARQATKLKALGFMGIMVQGAHHQQHHLMMAKGEFSH
jgi:hypothetical protein